MREIQFVRKNKEKWQEYQLSLKSISQQSPDSLADMYIDITNDLSYAQSHYPDSRIAIYLNELSVKLHQEITVKKRTPWIKFIHYWKYEIPEVMFQTRKELLISGIIFAVSMLIGVVSTLNDIEFPRVILGDQYVDMTLENIQSGDPMAVYKKMNESDMFSHITLNNIRVSFNAFISGLFTSIATGYILVINGVMLGSFQTFFYEHNLFKDAFLAVWLHGTLEISAIIIAGAAGITMGNGWLFPGTYSRVASFRRAARRGVKIIVGLIPIFIIAGFIESYLTRHTDLPDVLRLGIILLSLAFVIYYYIIYPKMLSHGEPRKD